MPTEPFVKVQHINIFGVVHRQVVSSNGLSTISCDLPYVDADEVQYSNYEYAPTDGMLTCVMCLVLDTRTGRLLPRKANL